MSKVFIYMLVIVGMLFTGCSTVTNQRIMDDRNLNEGLTYPVADSIVLYEVTF